MALQTSGMISLNDIHVEAGGSSGTACTINDSDIRGLINKSSGAAMDFADWYGASAAVDTQTVTVGLYSITIYGNTSNIRGFSTDVSTGSISDGTCNFKSGATIEYLAYSDQNGNATKQVQFRLVGNHSNSGFTTMSVAGTNYARTSASYIYTGGRSYWTWSSSTNPFGTTANATKVVTFS
jgi:hypothetical protein